MLNTLEVTSPLKKHQVYSVPRQRMSRLSSRVLERKGLAKRDRMMAAAIEAMSFKNSQM